MIILTEKPSVAKAFAEALKVPRKGFVYENENYCVVNALGHLLENYAPEDYDPALKKWSLDALPVIPEPFKYKVVEKTKKQLEIIETCFKKRKNDELLLATDAEREGELIGAEILNHAGFSKYGTAKRFWVSEALTPEVILAGMKNAKPLSEYAACRRQGYARQQADWLVGMNLTRLVSLKSGKLLHFGRVQTAVLAAVHERDNSVKNFVSTPYFEVKAVLRAKERLFSVKMLNPDNGEFPTRFSTDPLKEMPVLKNIKNGTITEITKEPKTVMPPQLYNLTALQKDAHKKFSYAPEQTLEIAQSLYEKHKCLSYPRTPSRVMGDENVNLVLGIYEKLLSAYEGSPPGAAMSGSDKNMVSIGNKRLFNSEQLQDHHALIPLAALPAGSSMQEENIYSLVFKSFFTILKPPYKYNSVSIEADISGLFFQGNGIEVLQTGWKTRDGADDDDEDEQLENYAGLEKDAQYPVESINTGEKKTEPKKHYTFSSLLQLMENPRNGEGGKLAGLGTPATRGSILQKLVDRKYIRLKGKSVLITDDGGFLINNILKNNELETFVSLPETTRWEERLHEDTQVFLTGIKDFIRKAVANTSMDAYKKEKTPLGKCPACGGDVYEGAKNFYCCNYKGNAPCRFAIWKEISGAAVTAEDAAILLAGKRTKFKKCKSKAGGEFKAAFILENAKVEFMFEDKK